MLIAVTARWFSYAKVGARCALFATTTATAPAAATALVPPMIAVVDAVVDADIAAIGIVGAGAVGAEPPNIDGFSVSRSLVPVELLLPKAPACIDRPSAANERIVAIDFLRYVLLTCGPYVNDGARQSMPADIGRYRCL